MTEEAAALLAEACRVAAPANTSAEDDDLKLEASAEQAWEAGRVDEAESLYRNLLSGRRTTLGEQHEVRGASTPLHGLPRPSMPFHALRHPSSRQDTIVAMDALGAVLYMKSDVGGAQELLLEALKARRETLGNDHPDTVASLANSGMMLKENGKLDEAEPLLREALEHMEAFRAGGDSDPKLLTELLICQANLGSLFKDK